MAEDANNTASKRSKQYIATQKMLEDQGVLITRLQNELQELKTKNTNMLSTVEELQLRKNDLQARVTILEEDLGKLKESWINMMTTPDTEEMDNSEGKSDNGESGEGVGTSDQERKALIAYKSNSFKVWLLAVEVHHSPMYRGLFDTRLRPL